MQTPNNLRTILSPLLGLIIGFFLAYGLEVGIFETWHSLGKPPEPVHRIIGANENAVYVQGTSGQIYLYTYFSFEGNRTNVWEEADQSDYQFSPTYPGGYFITIPPLFRVMQMHEIDIFPLIEAGGEVKFVLAEDNTIWMWNHGSWGIAVIFLPVFPILGLALGIFFSKKRTISYMVLTFVICAMLVLCNQQPLHQKAIPINHVKTQTVEATQARTLHSTSTIRVFVVGLKPA